ncbi:hypothetical protein [Roseovarius sp. 2305UL8-3]
MFNIFANSFMTATRTGTCNHQGDRDRFSDRRQAELIAHTTGRRRD